MKTGVELIAEEREEQIIKHKNSIANDIKFNNREQLSIAASLLCLENWGCNSLEDMTEEYCPHDWIESKWKKMLEKPHLERLVIAGALIAAEIDRLQNIK